jgi:hypothetical protein
MATATLDTLTIVKRLREAGVPEGQAETWATIWRDQRELDLSQLATKADLDQLGQRLEQRISARITESQNALIKGWCPSWSGRRRSPQLWSSSCNKAAFGRVRGGRGCASHAVNPANVSGHTVAGAGT